jgi:hypothetical protein
MSVAKGRGDSEETEKKENHDATHERYVIWTAEFFGQYPCKQHNDDEQSLQKKKPWRSWEAHTKRRRDSQSGLHSLLTFGRAAPQLTYDGRFDPRQ